MTIQQQVLLSILAVVGGYLSGSIPFAYLAGRLFRGIDLREYGSGSIGGSNVYEQVSRPLIVVVGLLDIFKAALPCWLALRLGLGLPTALAAGLAALVGHNWPLYLDFKGGRGISACLGVLLVIFPWGLLWELLVILLGRILRHGIVNLLGLATLPLLAWALKQPPEVVAAGGIMFIIVSLKRLEANRRPLPHGPERWQVLWRRWLLDRDIEDWESWISQRPEGAAPPWRMTGTENGGPDTRPDDGPPNEQDDG
jgi:glycerol-3-phosphate acyltransferase PlsY